MEYHRLLGILQAQSDEQYRLFCGPITNARTPILGVRMPQVRLIALDIIKSNESIDDIPFHQFVEMDIVIGLSHVKNSDSLIQKRRFLDAFLPGVDNWMVIDALALSLSTKDYDQGIKIIKKYAGSKYPFVRRFAYIFFLGNFIREDTLDDLFEIMKADEHYYVKMGMAWLLCECYVHFPQKTEVFLSDNALNDWTINKAISKIHDSFRVSEQDKKRLKNYRRQKNNAVYNKK